MVNYRYKKESGFKLNFNWMTYLLIFLLFFSISVFTFRKIILSPGMIALNSEWGIPPFPEQIKDVMISDLFSWKSFQDLGSWSDYPSGIYHKIFIYSLANFGFNGEFITKFNVVFTMTFAGFFIFLLAKNLKISFLGSFIAGFLYMWTSFTFERTSIGHVYLLIDYMLMPLAILLFLKFLENRNYKLFFIILTLLVIISFEEIFLMTSLSFLFISILFIKDKKNMFKVIGIVFLFIVLHFVIKGHWLALINQLSFRTISARFGDLPVTFIGSFGRDLHDPFRLLGFNINYFTQSAMKWKYWLPISFILPLLVFLPLLLNKKDNRVILFTILALIAITIISASKGIIGDLWVPILENIPVMRIFRDTAKPLPLACLSFSILLGISHDSIRNVLLRYFDRRLLWKKLPEIQNEIFVKLSIFIVFILFILAYSWPFLTGNLDNNIQTYHFDEKYENLYNWLSSQEEDFRIFSLPAPYPTYYFDQKFYKNTYDVMSVFPGKPAFYVGHIYAPQFIRFSMKSIHENRTQNLGEILGLSNMKYLVFDRNKKSISTEVDWYSLNLYPEESFTNEKIFHTLESQGDIEILSEDSNILIYENSEYLPHLNPVTRLGLVGGNLDTLFSLTYTDNVDFNDDGLLFASQLSEDNFEELSDFPNWVLIVEDENFFDFLLMMTPDKHIINTLGYTKSKNPMDEWSVFHWFWHDWYLQTAIEHSTFTMSHSNLSIPHQVDSDDLYNVYAKVYLSPRSSHLNFYLDGSLLRKIETKTDNYKKFEWVNLDEVYLEGGDHNIEIEGSGSEEHISFVVVVPKNQLNEKKIEFEKFMADKKVLLINEVEKWGCTKIHENYRINSSIPMDAFSHGSVCALDSFDNILEHSLYVPKDSTYNVKLRFYSPNDEEINLLINDQFYMVHPLKDGINYMEIGDLDLEKGFSKISIWINEGTVFLDQFELAEVEDYSLRSDVEFNFERLSPSEFKINSNSDGPYAIFFSERFNSLWGLSSEKKEFKSYPGFSFGNMFIIRENTSNQEMKLLYKNQIMFDILLKLIIIYFIFLAAILLVPSEKLIQLFYKIKTEIKLSKKLMNK